MKVKTLMEQRLYEGGWIIPSGKYLYCNHAKGLHHDMLALLYFNPELDKDKVLRYPEEYYDPNDETWFQKALNAGFIRISSNCDGEKILAIDISGTNKITQNAFKALAMIVKDFDEWDFELETPNRFYQPKTINDLFRQIRTSYKIE